MSDEYEPNELTHEQLQEVHVDRPNDGDLDGREERVGIMADCSTGCKWFHVLEGDRGMDWGVCGNKRSPRAGLLTFEHDGCDNFETEESNE